MSELLFHRELCLAYLALAALVFIALLFIPAAYGRYTRAGWGPTINTRLAWVLMECPSVFVFAACMLLATRPITPASGLLGALWLAHYLHRTFIFPFRMKMAGHPTPLLIAAMGFIFNCGNAYLNGRWLYALSSLELDVFNPRYLLGVALFVGGFLINYRSDRVLANLRKPGETGYKIPSGGLYRWLSCPNYFGELLEWTGFAVAAWSLPALTFVVWTAANLGPRARTHHRWYREKFADYPAERKALIPGIW